MNKQMKLKLLKEKKRREKLLEYKENFELFSQEQIRILPKDPTKGFIPFEFNEPQRLINEALEKQRRETGRVRAIVLKARQQGISTYCASRVYWKTYFTDNSKSVVMAHDAATSDALFAMSRNIIQNMNDDYKPEFKRSNAKEILFEHNNAGYRLYTAGSKEAGRGTTPTIAHLSEVAFWQFDQEILAGLFQGISQSEGTEVILESTANGATGEFFRLYKGAERGENEYVPIFIPWFLTPEYSRTAPPDFETTVEEDKLVEDYGLSNDQLYWRRLKIAESGELKFKQEYPASAEEAFVVSGNSVFDQTKITSLIPQPIQSTREYDERTGMFEQLKEGPLHQWIYPQHDDKFVIGADISLGVGLDHSVAVVLNPDNKICALYRSNRIDPSHFGDILFYLGRYYNNALIAPESNSIGIATINRLRELNYINLYHQVKTANISDEETTRPGFRTTSSSKPFIIGQLKRAVDDEELWIPSNVIIQEMKDYVVSNSGKMEALPGCHDDTIIALAIAFEVMRTHREKLTNDKVSWKDRVGSFQQDNTTWF